MRDECGIGVLSGDSMCVCVCVCKVVELVGWSGEVVGWME